MPLLSKRMEPKGCRQKDASKWVALHGPFTERLVFPQTYQGQSQTHSHHSMLTQLLTQPLGQEQEFTH